LDLSFGLKYIHTDANLRLAREKEYDGYFPSVQSVFCGSKSVFDGIFAIGFRF
jgi:hypothetical protein